MTDEELQAIRARCEAASPAPWEQEEWSGRLRDAHGESLCAADPDGADAGLWRKEDARFVIHARIDVPTLLAEVDRLQKALGCLHPRIRAEAFRVAERLDS